MVFNLEEIRKYNPYIDKWIASYNWYVTTTNFAKEIKYCINYENTRKVYH